MVATVSLETSITIKLLYLFTKLFLYIIVQNRNYALRKITVSTFQIEIDKLSENRND